MANRSRPTKRRRRTQAEIATIEEAIITVLEIERPANVRGVFYQLSTRGVVAKTEAEYKGTVGRLLVNMRRRGAIPYDWIGDSTRWMRKPRTFSSLRNMLEYSQQTYRRALWDELPAYVEIWLEKDALAGVLYPETQKWDVPLMVTRGYPSLSFLYEAAVQIAAQGKPAFIYYFGDYDPSGVDIPRFVEQSLREIAPAELELTFQVVAVRPEQIKQYNLPTRPVKPGDSRKKGFGKECVEVDAFSANTLRDMVRECILRHVDDDVLAAMQRTEEAERETLAWLTADLKD